MSRIGAKPVKIDPSVQIKAEANLLTVTGPKGNLSVTIPSSIKFKQEEGVVSFTRASDEPNVKALHGLTRSLFLNSVIGVTKGYQKKLELVGTGYRVKPEGANIELSVGFSHPVKFNSVPGITITTEGNNIIYIQGIDKHLVGQVAANIRAVRPPEPYKGKGIRYSDEVVRRKAGKAAKATTK